LEAKVERVIIEDLKDNTYYASLIIKAGNKKLTIDSRPSDAVALALKFRAPLFISESLIKKGILIDLEAETPRTEIERTYGIYFQDISPSVAQYFKLQGTMGIIITDLEPGGPAEEAGIKKGDIIIHVEGEKVNNAEEFQKSLSQHEPSDAIRMEIFRKGETITYTLSVKR
jgi:membrane-associated protease RseP (regulator of RpoE activity)